MRKVLCGGILSSVTMFAGAQCMSHSTEIPMGQSVCFSKSMRQYMCTREQGETGLKFVQKLSMRSSLNDRGICWHVDMFNDAPARDQQLSQATQTPFDSAKIASLQKEERGR